MKNFSSLKMAILALLTITSTSVLAQDMHPENKEGFDYLPKGRLRSEIACFSSLAEDEKNNSIKPGKTIVNSSGDNHMTFKRENIVVTVKSSRFDKSKYKIRGDAEGNVWAINGKYIFGVDGGMPTTVIQSVTVIIGTDTLRLPPNAYANLFQPNFCAFGEVQEDQWGCPRIYISSDKKRIYIYSSHSDAAGAYEVIWIIQDRKYLRRVVDSTN